MLGIRNDTEVLGAGQTLVETVGRVGKEKFVTSGADKIVRTSSVTAVVNDRIDNVGQLLHDGLIEILDHTGLQVVIEGERPLTIWLEETIDGRNHIENRNHDGDKELDTHIDGGRGPCGPAALGGTGDTESVDLRNLRKV